MKVGRSVIARISATTISTLSVPMPVETTDTRWPSIRAGGRCELPVSVLQLDGIEARGDPGGPVMVAGEEDVLGQVARSESDVVLPFTVRDRDAAISGRIDAGIRVRQDLSLAHVACFAGAKLGRG